MPYYIVLNLGCRFTQILNYLSDIKEKSRDEIKEKVILICSECFTQEPMTSYNQLADKFYNYKELPGLTKFKDYHTLEQLKVMIDLANKIMDEFIIFIETFKVSNKTSTKPMQPVRAMRRMRRQSVYGTGQSAAWKALPEEYHTNNDIKKVQKYIKDYLSEFNNNNAKTYGPHLEEMKQKIDKLTEQKATKLASKPQGPFSRNNRGAFRRTAKQQVSLRNLANLNSTISHNGYNGRSPVRTRRISNKVTLRKNQNYPKLHLLTSRAASGSSLSNNNSSNTNNNGNSDT